jgi:hypothetical protein
MMQILYFFWERRFIIDVFPPEEGNQKYQVFHETIPSGQLQVTLEDSQCEVGRVSTVFQ